MNAKLAILGAGGHGKVVADAALAGEWDSVEFFDDGFPARSRQEPWLISGTGAALMERFGDYQGIIVAIGENRTRLSRTLSLLQAGAEVVTIVHPAAIVSPLAAIDRGCLVSAGAVINPGAAIGLACIINSAAVIEHDCRLDDGVHLCPGAILGGDCQVGKCSWIGIGSTTRQGIRIGSGVLAGAGSVIVKSVPDGVKLYGNPASIVS